jgi:hypothetical protein
VQEDETINTKILITLRFEVGQNLRDSQLLLTFIKLFGCGNVNIYENQGKVVFSVKRFSDIAEKIIPFYKISYLWCKGIRF